MLTILNFFFQKKKFFFAEFLPKHVKVYWLARNFRNFDDYPSLQPKISPPKHFSLQCILGFPTGRDSATFRDNGTEVSLLSRDKGTMGQAQNLATGRDRPGQSLKILPRAGTGRDSLSNSYHGTGRAGTASHNPGRDTGRDNHYFSVKIWGRTEQLLFFAV